MGSQSKLDTCWARYRSGPMSDSNGYTQSANNGYRSQKCFVVCLRLLYKCIRVNQKIS